MANKARWDNSPQVMEPKVGCSPTVPESELYRCIKAVMPRETKNQQPMDCIDQGMLRWTLHKKVKNNPANSSSLVCVLIKELERAEKWDSRKCIIPLLHTLMYAIIQTAYIPDELYKRIYDFCKRLMTYPQPYCTVGLSYARQMKTERAVPGLMYQRMVAAEQSLKNDYYPCQEKVFVLADPEVFSDPLEEVMLCDIEASVLESSGALSPLDHMRNVVHHTIQAALGPEHCHGPTLAQALQDVGQDVESHFQEVLATLEQSVNDTGRAEKGVLKTRLQKLYSKILTNQEAEPLLTGLLCDCPLPNPEMNVQLWTEDVDIWREVARWLRSTSMSESLSISEEQEDDQLVDANTELNASDNTRLSVMSTDSGIERDLPANVDSSPSTSLDNSSLSTSWEQKSDLDSRLSRRGGMKMRPSVSKTMALMQDTLEDHGGGNGERARKGSTLQRRAGTTAIHTPITKQPKHYTARIVVLGDDRIVGRLAKAYYHYRKREARRLFLTTKVNLQFYYIPVCKAATHISSDRRRVNGNPCTLGSYLSMVDPWYNCNIKGLGSMIPKLAKMQQANPGKPKEPITSDVISYYVRTGQQPVFFSVYFVKLTFQGKIKDPVEEVFLTHLEVEFPEFKQISASVREKPKRNTGETCGAMVSITYKKVSLRGTDIDKGLSCRTSGVQINAIPSSEAEDLNCLSVTLNESPTKTKNSTVESNIRTNNMKIDAKEGRSFTVVLDRDARRTFARVQCMEISLCLDPGYCIHKNFRSKFTVGEETNAGLSKYMNKVLTLPINTFAGIIN